MKGILKCPNCGETSFKWGINFHRRLLDINHVKEDVMEDLENLIQPYIDGSVCIGIDTVTCIKCHLEFAYLMIQLGNSKIAYVYLPYPLTP